MSTPPSNHSSGSLPENQPRNCSTASSFSM
jgi:hypothetical protein